ncbi:MAG: hypothetical protein ABR976_20580 [Terracidiphilus sp.]|jgi:hypothetical protein
MHQTFTAIAILLKGNASPFVDLLILFIAATSVIAGLIGRYKRFFIQWLDGIRGRDWARVTASVDVVSSVVQTENGRYGERIIGYLGTLTYFYRNPDLQMGEYSRMFSTESEATAWTGALKGRQVLVHVDPRDPTHSVLREDDLPAASPMA